jgi:hypothetical protein
VIATLGGQDADRDREVAQKTRRVVMASLGVLLEQKADRKRNRAVAMAAMLVVFFIVGPPLWWVADTLLEEEHVTNLASEIGVWCYFLCTGLLASALVVGWVRRKS